MDQLKEISIILYEYSIRALGFPVFFGLNPYTYDFELEVTPGRVEMPIFPPVSKLRQVIGLVPEYITLIERRFPGFQISFRKQPLTLIFQITQLQPMNLPFELKDGSSFYSSVGVAVETRTPYEVDWLDQEQAHCLVAGATGAGKTNTIRAMLLSLAYNTKPQDLRLVLLDPKRSGLLPLSVLPHVMGFHYEINDCVTTLRRVKRELLNRIQNHQTHPLILVVIEELAELTYDPQFGREVIDDLLPTIGRMGREFNIRLLVGTQKPTMEAVGSQLRQQLSIRVIGRLESSKESRWITDDTVDAHRLPGKGLMYAKKGPETYQLVQVGFVSDPDHEVEKILQKHPIPKMIETDPEVKLPTIEGQKMQIGVQVAQLAQLPVLPPPPEDPILVKVRENILKWAREKSSISAICDELGLNAKDRNKRNLVRAYIIQVKEEL